MTYDGEGTPLDPKAPEPMAVADEINRLVQQGSRPEVFGDQAPRFANYALLAEGVFLLARVREVHESEAMDRTLAALDREALHHVARAAIIWWREQEQAKWRESSPPS